MGCCGACGVASRQMPGCWAQAQYRLHLFVQVPTPSPADHGAQPGQAAESQGSAGAAAPSCQRLQMMLALRQDSQRLRSQRQCSQRQRSRHHRSQQTTAPLPAFRGLATVAPVRTGALEEADSTLEHLRPRRTTAQRRRGHRQKRRRRPSSLPHSLCSMRSRWPPHCSLRPAHRSLLLPRQPRSRRSSQQATQLLQAAQQRQTSRPTRPTPGQVQPLQLQHRRLLSI